MKKVLIVDADKYARVKFSLLLSECECEIESAGTVPEAVERMKEGYFDCVILDVESCNARGYEAIPVIRAISSDTEVIATTSDNSRELEAKTREQDVFYYHIKSFDPEELKLAVKNVFGKHENRIRRANLLENRKRMEGQ